MRTLPRALFVFDITWSISRGKYTSRSSPLHTPTQPTYTPHALCGVTTCFCSRSLSGRSRLCGWEPPSLAIPKSLELSVCRPLSHWEDHHLAAPLHFHPGNRISSRHSVGATRIYRTAGAYLASLPRSAFSRLQYITVDSLTFETRQSDEDEQTRTWVREHSEIRPLSDR